MAELIGRLISRFPFHKLIVGLFAFDIEAGLIPETGFNFIDELNILLIAVMISGGIARILTHIFCPEGRGLKALLVSFLSSVMTMFFASYIFSGLAVWMSGHLAGKILWTLLKIVIFAAVLGLFYLFVKSTAKLADGKWTPGFLCFFALRTIGRTLAADVVCVFILTMLI